MEAPETEGMARPLPRLARHARRAAGSDAGAPVWREPGPETAGVAVVENRNPDLRLDHWIMGNRGELESWLQRHGAIHFSGFGVEDAAEFSGVAAELCGELTEEYGDLPRAQLGERIYHTTPYPAHQSILLHNEGAHLPAWPERMCFYCQVPADEQGETTLLDARLMWDLLDDELRTGLETKGMGYVRNFHPRVDQPWQEVFQTVDRAVVEARCQAAGIRMAWTAGDALRTVYTVPARLRSPATGELLFFSQIFLFHPACLDPATRASLRALYAEEDLPRNLTYGDGSPIPDQLVLRFLDACEERTLRVPWKAGEICLVDNVRFSHGRRPYAGARRVLVAMGGMGGRSR